MCQTQPQQLKIIYFQETFPYANSALLFPKTPHKNNFTQKERNFLHISGIKLWESKIKSLKGISKNKKGIKVTETPTYTLQQLQATIWQITAKKKKNTQICSGMEEQIALRMSTLRMRALRMSSCYRPTKHIAPPVLFQWGKTEGGLWKFPEVLSSGCNKGHFLVIP